MIKFMFAEHHESIDIVRFLFNAYFAISTNADEKVSPFVPGHGITELTKRKKTIKKKTPDSPLCSLTCRCHVNVVMDILRTRCNRIALIFNYEY